MSNQASVQAPIPYRAETAVSAGQLTSVLLVTVLLLGIFLVLALYAKKRGWLQKLMPASAVRPAGTQWRLYVQAQRISRLTTVYKVEDGARAWLIVESAGQVSVSALPDQPVTGEGIDEPA